MKRAPRSQYVRTLTSAQIRHRRGGMKLAILPLEDRIVPFNYTVNNNTEGAIVEIIGIDGTVAAVTDALGIAAIDNPPTPASGVAGTGLWGADVVLPPGVDFFINKEFAVNGPYWTGSGVANAITFTELNYPTPLFSCPTCGPGTDLLPESDPNDVSPSSAGADVSSTGVRYFDGVATFTDEDLESGGFGFPWSQTRSWSNGVRYGDFGVGYLQGFGINVSGSTSSLSLNQRLGAGWVNDMLPRLRFLGDDFFESGTSSSGMYFHKTGSNTWSPLLYRQSTASVANGEVTITDEVGNRTVFFDNSATQVNLRGQFKKFTRANGDETSVESYNSNGDVLEIRRSQGQTVESWQYEYGNTSILARRMTGVSLRRSADGGTTWQDIRAVKYLYTDWTAVNSPALQLKAAIVHSGDLNGPVLETKYYRYYSNGETDGFQSALKFVVSSTSFDRITAAYGVTTVDQVDALTDAQIAVYADVYFKYYGDHRVKEQLVQGTGCSVCTAGKGSYQFSYYTNPNYSNAVAPPDDPYRFGEWMVRTTETLPDGNQNIVYLNSVGQAILKVFKDTAEHEWSTFHRFDSVGRVLWVADPSGVTGRNEQYGDLLHRVNGNFEFLNDSSGLITGFEYGKTTTATATQPGDVKGYVKSTFRRQGEMGPGYEVTASNKYFSHTVSGVTTYPLASTATYPTVAPTQTTTDDFSSVDGWTFIGGSWQQAGGVLSQTSSSGETIKTAALTNRSWSGSDQEIVASVRVNDWASGGAARAGVSVRTSPVTGQGYGLVFHGTNAVQFVNDGITWGNWYSFNWQPGVWYRFRLRVEGTLLKGKVWQAGQAEPTDWMYTQIWGQKPFGAPGLNGGASDGGQGSATVSFKDVQVSETTYPALPAPQAADDFSAVDGWTFVNGTWQLSGGVLSQSSNADSNGASKAAILTDRQWTAPDQEIVASVRVDSMAMGWAGRAGVTVRTNSATGQGYGLVLNGTNQIRFLNDGVEWGNIYSFPWQSGVWYRLRLRAEGALLRGKAWVEGQPEPADWMFTQAWGQKPFGAPGLCGGAAADGSGTATASFKDVTVSETTYPALPAPQSPDDFSAVDGWTFAGGGAWRTANGALSQTSTVEIGDVDKVAVRTDRTWGADQEVVASVRVDSMVMGGAGRAGVAVRTNAVTGQGYALVLNGTNQVKFLDDGVAWGNSYSFTWQTGVWYRLRLRVEGTILYGKAWAVGETEPTDWMFTQTGWSDRPSGSPSLYGGSALGGYGSATASFDDVQATSGTDTSTANFSATGSGWTFAGVGGTWQTAGGVLAQTNTAVSNAKAAVLADRAWGEDQEIVASVRVDTWTGNDYSRAGVNVRTDPLSGRGYCLVFNGTNQVRFLDDGITWGNTYSFTWQTGTWYRFRLRIEREVLKGKVWLVGQSEPTDWMFTQSGWGTRPTGCPALNGGASGGGSDTSTASFTDVQVAGSPPPSGDTTTTPKPFSGSGAAWTFAGIGATWQATGGVISQTNTAVSNWKAAVLGSQSWGEDQEIIASVRVDSWGGGPYARAGVNVRTDPLTGSGYGLVFNGTNQVRFVDDGVTWGNTYSFNWQTGVWYRFRLRIVREVLYGKVWQVGQAEPADWMLTQSGWGSKPTGCPALNGGASSGGSDASTASFDDVQTSGSPAPDGNTIGSSETFSTTNSGQIWAMAGGGSWQEAGGMMSQTNIADAPAKAAVLDGQSWGPDQDITASVRVDSWVNGEYARAGVTVRTNTVTGQGYGLVFNGTNQVRFVNDGVGWGNTFPFTWQTGVWYRFRLKSEGALLLGKVWLAGQNEPTAWRFRQDGWTDKPTGNPGLNGGAAWTGQGNSTASFKDVTAINVVPDVGRTTSLSYVWYGDPAVSQPQSVTTQLPTVSTAQNGPGTPDLSTTVYDQHGQPIWTQDGGGFLHYLAFDLATGGVVTDIIDVDTSRSADFAGLPAGWVTPAGGGAHLMTTYDVDNLGRPTRIVHPGGAVDFRVYDDLNATVRTYPGWTGTTTTGPVTVLRRDRVGGDVTIGNQTYRYTYADKLTMAPSTIAVDAQGRPTGAEPVSNVLTLTRDYYTPAGQFVWHDTYFDLGGLSYTGTGGQPVFALGAEGINFLRTRYDYDHRGRRSRVLAPSGVITRTVYDGQNRLVSEWIGSNDTPASGWWSPTNSAGMVPLTEYVYDDDGVGDGNLTRMTQHPGGGVDRVTDTWFDWRNRPVAVKAGVEATEAAATNRPLTYFDYDILDEVTRTRGYDGDGVTPVDANADGVPDAPAAALLRAQTDVSYDPQGRAFRTTVYRVNQSTGAVAGTPLTTDVWFDHRGFTVKTARPGGIVDKRVFDGAGRPAATFRSDGGEDTSWADARTLNGDMVLSQEEFGYGPDGLLAQLTTRERAYGASGTGALGTMTNGVAARVAYAGRYYDALGRLVADVDVGTNGGVAWTRPATVPAPSDNVLVTGYAYDSAGRLFETTGPDGVVSRTNYDAAGWVTSSTLAYGTADEATITSAYNTGGQLLNITGPGGAVTRYGYDEIGRAATVTDAYGTTVAKTTGLAYNRLGDITAVTTPGGAVTATGYDAVGRVTTTVRASGMPEAKTTAFAYDVVGRVLSVTDPANKTTTTAYDDVARTMTVTDPTGRAWTTAYDAAGHVTAVTDPNGKTTSTAYDLLSRVSSTTDPLQHVTQFQYTVNGDRDAVIDPQENRTETVYDSFGRTAAIVDPLGHATTFEHDRVGRATAAIDRLGRRREFGYNGLGKETSETWFATGGALVQTQTFGYDAAGNLTSATDPDGNYTLTYDALNRPMTVAEPAGLNLTFGYDAAGNRSSVSDDQGGTATSTFDIFNRLTRRTLHTPTADARISISYTLQDGLDVVGRFADLAGTDPAGTTVYNHDDAGRVTQIVHMADGGAVLANYEYGYDAAGRVGSRTENGVTTAFGYDDAGQLTQDGPTGHTYDGAGNRTDAAYVIGVGNRLQSDGTWAYTYDDAGELVKKSKGASAETWTYGYDHRGQMVWAERRATDGGSLLDRVEYRYDALGNRVRRVQTDGTGATVSDERFAYDGWDTAKGPAAGTANLDVWADLDATGNVTARRLFGAGTDDPVARVTAAGAVAWYATDLQGSVRLVTDAAGAVLGSRDFNEFGGITGSSGTGLDRYAYTGREWDAALGLQYTRARMYDPAAGRFNSEDPLGLAAGDPNVYRYVGNGPLAAKDPSGMDWGDRNIWEPLGEMYNGNGRFRGVVNATEKAASGMADIPYIIRDAGASVYSEISGRPVNLYSDYAKGLEQARQAGQGDQYAAQAALNAISFNAYGLTQEGIAATEEYIRTGDPTRLEEFSGELLVNAAMWAPMGRGKGNCRAKTRGRGNLDELEAKAAPAEAEGALREDPEFADRDPEASGKADATDQARSEPEGDLTEPLDPGEYAPDPVMERMAEGYVPPETAPTSPSPAARRFGAIRDAFTDANGKRLSAAEREGIKFTIREVEALGYELEGSVKYNGNQGIDLVFEGTGLNRGRIALAEAKSSGGLGSLRRDTLGIRQGSYEFFETRLQRGGRLDLLQELQTGNADLFGGFSGSRRLFQFDPNIFLRDVNFRRVPGAVRLIP